MDHGAWKKLFLQAWSLPTISSTKLDGECTSLKALTMAGSCRITAQQEIEDASPAIATAQKG